VQSLFELVVVLIVVVVVGNLLFGVFGGRSRGVPQVVRRPLMTPREIEFWHLLRRAAGQFHVAPQVAMNALLNADRGLDASRRQRTRNQFQSKVVDFALVDDSGLVQLLIELDDRSHLADKDATRDRMTRQAGYRTLRVTGRTARDIDLLAESVRHAIS
jgi:very-short-patch-repair endonuclease